MSLLIPVATIEVDGIVSFVTKEKFRERTVTDGVRFVWTGENFDEHFLSKIEKNVPAASLCIQRLRKASSDSQIIAKLPDTHETMLSHCWELLKKQGSGEKGALLVNGCGNIAFIRDEKNILWTMHFCWHIVVDGWGVEAHSQNSWEWHANYQIISR